MRHFFQCSFIIAHILLPFIQSQESVDGLSGVKILNVGIGCDSVENSYSDFVSQKNSETAVPLFVYNITNSLADFISLHFTAFNLPNEDYIVLRVLKSLNHTAGVAVTYSGRNASGKFYSEALFATSISVELYAGERRTASALQSCVGFHIADYRFLAQPAMLESASTEQVCGADDTREAACFKPFSLVMSSTNAIIRLLIHKSSGSFFCTGWLVGCEGHVITNNHCISAQEHADNTQFEMYAHGTSCTTSCSTPYGCGGTILATSARMLVTSVALDYTLLSLSTNPTDTYGYFKLRSIGAVLNERIYIPQHPSGWGARVAMKTDDGYGLVESLTTGGCAVDQVAYSLDTQGGSSGSPVVAWSDNAVVALHHCGGCPNTAININKIVDDLRRQALLPLCALSTDTPVKSNQPVAPTPVAVPVTVTNTQIVDGTIYATAKFASVDYIDFTISSDSFVSLDVLSMETNGNGVYVDLNGDCNSGFIDSSIILFKMNNGSITSSTYVGGNDNAPEGYGSEDGSIIYFDSFMSLSLSAGSYRLSVGTSPLNVDSALAKSTSLSNSPRICSDTISNYGNYRVTIKATGTDPKLIVKSAGSYIGNQCSISFSNQPYTNCAYHKEASMTQMSTIDGSIVRKSGVSVSVDSISFTTASFSRVSIEIVSYASANGYAFYNLNGFCGNSYIDPVIYLFKKEGESLSFKNVITASDDDDNFYTSGVKRSSISFRDPYISLSLGKGEYVVVVGRYPLTLNDAINRIAKTSTTSLTPQSCGKISNVGNYRTLIRSSAAFTTLSPNSFTDRMCLSAVGKMACFA